VSRVSYSTSKVPTPPTSLARRARAYIFRTYFHLQVRVSRRHLLHGNRGLLHKPVRVVRLLTGLEVGWAGAPPMNVLGGGPMRQVSHARKTPFPSEI